MIPFSISIAVLSLVQGAVVAVPRALAPAGPAWVRSRRWALIPPVSVLGFVLIAREAERASADGLTYLALLAVPALAALALGWLAWYAEPPRPRWALMVLPLFVLAWVDRGGVAGQTAALGLSALSCAALGALLAAVTPARWLAAGIAAMAVADSALVASDLLQRPNDALNAAHPAAGLPRLQSAVFGSAVMGYGDLFLAGVLGGLLAGTMGRRWQLRGAALTALLALVLDLLFFVVDELPATVPVALTLLVLTVRRPDLLRARAPRASRSPAREARSGLTADARPPERSGPGPARNPPPRAPAAQ